jgi:hypothetical protein
MTAHPQVAERPAYIFSKMTGTLLFQLIALNTSPKKVQIVTFNPGLVYGAAWKSMGFGPEPFDSGEILFSVYISPRKLLYFMIHANSFHCAPYR